MFNLFKKNKATITSIEIPNFGWRKIIENRSIIQWINPEETIAISVHFFDLKPDIPTIIDLEKLKLFYRQSIAKINGGLIEVDLFKIKNNAVAKTIFKIPQEPSGMTYLASLTIPFENCSYVIKVQCAEIGMTGMRDAVMASKLLASGELIIGENGYENWFSDPYDTSFKDGTLMNRSEQSIFDKDFPDHPLTQARIIIEKFKNELIFKPEIEKLIPLNK